MSNNNEKDDNVLTVSQLYERLKSPKFLGDLYWNILSDIKEKNTYKLMREIAEGVINQKMEILDELNSDTEEVNMRRKTLVAEISVMSYAIDTVFSKVLYMRLEKICKEQIVKIIQELKDEGKISESAWAKFKFTENKSETSTENTVLQKDPVQPRKEVPKVPTRVGKRRRKANLNYDIFDDMKKANSNKEILDDLKKVNSMKFTDENKESITEQKRRSGRKVKESSNESMSSTDASTSLKNLFKEADNADYSDAESEVSLGRMSSSTVSSVHTSDLSSFDDEISLSSDEENGPKKKIPLKEVLKRYSIDVSSNYNTPKKTYAKSSKSPKPKKMLSEEMNQKKNEKTLVPVDDPSKSATFSASLQSPSENGLSKRARKPNSRYYSSDNILPSVLKVQERKKPLTLAKTNGQETSDDNSPQKKKAKVDDDIYGDVVTITQSINAGSSKDNVKTPAKEPEQSNLFQSRSTTRSLTSRRSAPLTLFST